jgi:hypothetical protein
MCAGTSQRLKITVWDIKVCDVAEDYVYAAEKQGFG